MSLKTIDSYLESHKNYWAPTTLKSVRSKLITLEGLSKKLDPEELFEKLQANQFGLYTIQSYFTIGKAYEKDILKTENIANFMKKKSYVFRNAYQDKEARMTSIEFKRILKQVEKMNKPELFNLVMLLGKCGLRRTEALEAKWTDIKGDELEVCGKGGKFRRVPIRPTWFKEVSHERIAGEAKGHLYFFRILCEYGFHDFRSYYATKMINKKGLSIKDVAKLLGHTSILTTQRYLRMDFERVKQVVLGR